MPRKRRYYRKRPVRRRQYRRRRYGTKPLVVKDKHQFYNREPRRNMIMYRGIGFPTAFFTKLVYVQQFLFDGGGTLPLHENIFRGNSVYDPDYTGSGHQPMYFDSYATIYTHYCVFASKIAVSFVNTHGSTGSAFVHCWIKPNADTIAATSYSEEEEEVYTKSTLLGANTGDQGTARLGHYMKTLRILGLNKYNKQEDVLGSSVTSNPVTQWYWHVGIETMDLTTPPDVYVRVKITYFVKFYELQNPDQS